MKHPDLTLEKCEFNLGRALVLRCTQSSDQVPHCGQCDSCHLGHQLSQVRSWLDRAGHRSRRRFVLGLVRRLHSVDLLQHVLRLLKPVTRKDFTYARTRATPSLSGDTATSSGDRALDGAELENSMANIWLWFEAASYWSKSNFLLGVLQKCDAHELHLVGIHAQTLLVPEQRAFAPIENYEAESIDSTQYSFHTEEHPELDLVTSLPGYSTVTSDPFSPDCSHAKPSAEIFNDDSGDDESFWGMEEESDPTCLVVPGSSKAYAGVARHVDFITKLPVHISKFILSFLDQTSLNNCVCVSKHWRILAEQVHKEFFVSQQLWEEVMLMQGAAAQGCNPVYAKDIDVAVPNVRLHSWDVIRTGEQEAPPINFKSETSMAAAYAGCSTRNIIMEERNVYCGPYNVMVLSDEQDQGRVIHTDGSHFIALGSTDRKVHFLNAETAKQEEPVISGHAGSIRCLALDSKRQFVLSGSFDTSIRKWSTETGKCLKIFHGHHDTINCVTVHGGLAASGARDNLCKVWDVETMECLRTFKHKEPVSAVSLSSEICISGCEAGVVKVWDLATGKLIKRLTGHHLTITAIKFDRWHIITGSRDGYALAWSSQGNHARCLTALRHPRDVLCVEFMYLRVITGAGDGKIRIWNMVTGQCLRIMRGNSRSDPITQMTAIGNRITINTINNVLVLNFEPIKYDYTLASDRMPPLVQYSSYSESPIRPQPYPYVRAQRMVKAGTANAKIVNHEKPKDHVKIKPPSSREMTEQVHSAGARLEDKRTASRDMMVRAASKGARAVRSAGEAATHPSASAKTLSASAGVRPKGTLSPALSAASAPDAKATDSDDGLDRDSGGLKRRVSWAFEDPEVPLCRDLSLRDTKNLLRSQMRIPEHEKVPPDFIYLKINAIQSQMKPTEASRNMEMQRREVELTRWRRLGRPSSSPSRVDPRTKVAVRNLSQAELVMLRMVPEPSEPDVKSVAESVKPNRGRSMPTTPIETPQPMTIITEYGSEKIPTRPKISLHSQRVKSSIPRPRLLRPHTASIMRNQPSAEEELPPRPLTSLSGFMVETTPICRGIVIKERAYSTSAKESSHVPMLMYPSDLQDKLNQLKNRKNLEQPPLKGSTPGPGKVSLHNHPLRSHVDFRLRTFQQEEKQLKEIQEAREEEQTQQQKKEDIKHKKLWLAKVKGQANSNLKVKTK